MKSAALLLSDKHYQLYFSFSFLWNSIGQTGVTQGKERLAKWKQHLATALLSQFTTAACPRTPWATAAVHTGWTQVNLHSQNLTVSQITHVQLKHHLHLLATNLLASNFILQTLLIVWRTANTHLLQLLRTPNTSLSCSSSRPWRSSGICIAAFTVLKIMLRITPRRKNSPGFLKRWVLTHHLSCLLQTTKMQIVQYMSKTTSKHKMALLIHVIDEDHLDHANATRSSEFLAAT